MRGGERREGRGVGDEEERGERVRGWEGEDLNRGKGEKGERGRGDEGGEKGGRLNGRESWLMCPVIDRYFELLKESKVKGYLFQQQNYVPKDPTL